VKVPPYLVKRLKQHFHQLKEFGVDLILGCNGYIWVSATVTSVKDESFQTPAALAAAPLTGVADVEIAISHEVRERICRLANCIRVLGALGLLISPDSILQTYEASIALGVAAKDILSSEFHVKIFEKEAEKRSKR
jgi:exosome complex component RRP4